MKVKTQKKIYETLGFHSNDELDSFILEHNRDKIKRESIKEQSDFYKGLQRDKEKYIICCPEYIAQADKFLNSNKDMLDNFRDLALELTYNRLIIDIQGQLEIGDNFHRIIMEVAGQ